VPGATDSLRNLIAYVASQSAVQVTDGGEAGGVLPSALSDVDMPILMHSVAGCVQPGSGVCQLLHLSSGVAAVAIQ
jgi:hypothetical protein